MGLALNHLQRQAIQNDPDWAGGNYLPQRPPRQGLALARQIGMLSYKSAALFEERFGRNPIATGRTPGRWTPRAADWSAAGSTLPAIWTTRASGSSTASTPMLTWQSCGRWTHGTRSAGYASPRRRSAASARGSALWVSAPTGCFPLSRYANLRERFVRPEWTPITGR